MDSLARCCKNCAPCSKDIKKIIDLNQSGLIIYLHKKNDNEKRVSLISNDGSIILHNTSGKKLQKSEFLNELHRCRTSCHQCKIIIQRVRKLLDEVVVIKKYDIISICKHCKKANTTQQCKKCDYILRKFLSEHRDLIEENQLSFKEWLIKVKTLLKVIQNAHYECQHMLFNDAELQKILKQLQEPFSLRIPNIDVFPHIEDPLLTQNISESKKILDEILTRIKYEVVNKRFTSENSLYSSPSTYERPCICKLLKATQMLGNQITVIAKSDKNIALENPLLQSLVDLEKEITLGTYKHIDKKLLDLLTATINRAKIHGLIPNITEKLLGQLINLQTVLTGDEQILSIHKKNVNDLIANLTNSVSEDVSIQLLEVLADVTKELAQQISEDPMEIKSKLNVLNKGGYQLNPKNIQNKSNKIHTKEILPFEKKILRTSIKEVVTTLIDLNKALKQGLFQPIDTKIVQGLSKYLKNILMTEQSQVTKGILEDLSGICMGVAIGIPKNLNTGLMQQLITELNYVIKQGLSNEHNKQLFYKYIKELRNLLIISLEETSKTSLSRVTSKKIKDESLKGNEINSEEIKTKKQRGTSDTGKLKDAQKEMKSKDQKNEETHHSSIDLEKMIAKNIKLSKDGRKNDKIKRKDNERQDKLKMSAKIEEEKLKALRLRPNLPQLHIKKPASSSNSFQDLIECPNESDSPKYIVIGTSLKPYSKHKEQHTLQPLDTKESDPKAVTSLAAFGYNSEKLPKKKKAIVSVSGVFMYQLSDKHFIDKGWTLLPIKKIMRRMNIYKIYPVKPESNWFERHKYDKTLYYDSGEILAEIDEDGRGKWFYRNGSLALEYYNAKEIQIGQRVVVYSSGEEFPNAKLKIGTVLAIFDYLGNGVIYDFNGNIRDGTVCLKLNLGMHLNSREIIDSQVFEISDVATPYDKYPAKTQSVINIQHALNKLRNENKIVNQKEQ